MNKVFIGSALWLLFVFCSTGVFGDGLRTVTDDAGREVQIPAQPQRIASLQDLFFSVPLIELGVLPIASHGRVVVGSPPFMRSSKKLTGIDFDNTDIAFLGGGIDIDPEEVARVEPDLIILSTNQDPAHFEQIAPTVLLDFRVEDKYALYDRLAEITGRETQLGLLKARYQEQLDELKSLTDPANTRINVIAPVQGNVRSYVRFAALGKLLEDAGFALPESMASVDYGQFQTYSPEAFPQMDADIVFVTYRAEQGETPADAFAQLEQTVPNFCDHLSACQRGKLLAIPRDETFASSYNALGVLAYMLIATSKTADLSLYTNEEALK